QTGENWVVVHGTIYDVKDLIYRHPGGVDGIVDFLGKDASKVFPQQLYQPHLLQFLRVGCIVG
ncbi:predicted protein, partial [Thalassiosira pseudonana CCMP1335]